MSGPWQQCFFEFHEVACGETHKGENKKTLEAVHVYEWSQTTVRTFFAQSALYVQFGRKGWLNWVEGRGCERLIGSLQSNWVAGWVTDTVFPRNSNLGFAPLTVTTGTTN